MLKKEDYSYYMNLNNPVLAPEIEKILANAPRITPVDYRDVNRIFDEKGLQNEIGYAKLKNGDYLVAMKTAMPDVTCEMAKWWFWWHVQESRRYQIWFPGEHLSLSYSPRNKKYFTGGFGEFQENTVYPVERIGNKTITLSIKFVHPRTFGLSEAHIKKTQNAFLLCGFVGVMRGMIRHTKMLHYFRPEGNGVGLISRFWLGNGLPPVLKILAANAAQACEMAKHCSLEYSRLGMILPGLYARYK